MFNEANDMVIVIKKEDDQIKVKFLMAAMTAMRLMAAVQLSHRGLPGLLDVIRAT